jgi:hypothetical protein
MAVNYDPQKAHEYYINYTKKGLTKGRHSTKGFTQTQKEQWQYAKHQLSEEHKGIKKGITESSKAERKAMSDAAKERIAALREQIKGASKEEKAMIREAVSGMIDNIRSQLKASKKDLTAQTKTKRENENEAYKDRKDQAYQHIKSLGSKKKGKK